MRLRSCTSALLATFKPPPHFQSTVTVLSATSSTQDEITSAPKPLLTHSSWQQATRYSSADEYNSAWAETFFSQHPEAKQSGLKLSFFNSYKNNFEIILHADHRPAFRSCGGNNLLGAGNVIELTFRIVVNDQELQRWQ